MIPLGAGLIAFVDETHICVDCGAEFVCKGRNAPCCVPCRKVRAAKLRERYDEQRRKERKTKCIVTMQSRYLPSKWSN
jgi:hypothetical protein